MYDVITYLQSRARPNSWALGWLLLMTIHYDFLLAALYSVTRTAGRKTNQYM